MRTSKPSCRLFVEQLETRDVPAGMIDVIYSPRDASLVIQGDNHDNHVRVEMPSLLLTIVSSNSGPIRFSNAFSGETYMTTDPILIPRGPSLFHTLNIDTGNGHDSIEVFGPGLNSTIAAWQYVTIASGNGNDQVLVEGLRTATYFGVSTGNDADLCTLRDVSQLLAGTSEVLMGNGDDRVVMLGSNSFYSMFIGLGNGDDVLEGDANAILLVDTNITVDGGTGIDRLLNADYFRAYERPVYFSLIEEYS